MSRGLRDLVVRDKALYYAGVVVGVVLMFVALKVFVTRQINPVYAIFVLLGCVLLGGVLNWLVARSK